MTMNYYNLGNSGLRVSRLALGTMTFGTELGWGADKETARAMFDAYVEAGGNFFDTADLYTGGTSETWLGEFVAERGLRDKAVIATKFTMNTEPGNPNAGGNGRKNIMRAVEASLNRLGTDYIDLYLLHVWDRLTPAEEVLRTLDDLVRAGKVRHVGLSDVPGWYAGRVQAIAELRGYEPVSALQLEYSLAERTIEHEFVPFGTRHGAGIMVWSPLASGLLSGKYRPTQAGNAGRLDGFRNTTHPGFQRFTQRNWEIVAELESVAAELGRSMAQVALNWVATQPGIASVILGATKRGQMQDNLGALDFSIPVDLRARLDAVSKPSVPFPHSYFGSEIQVRVTGGAVTGDKPSGYAPPVLVEGEAVSINGS
ncbi:MULTISPECIES: aldo/keto reductase [unclassified Mesorhizobium]|uniref:aldo/keto reductase n=1 Tax=unclassified Mesorhizobium TaxID=325217 RepID=UPI000FD6F054|nr:MULTISPECIES: aldo/keto reductase [unclassified Mesorhizobium]TGQ47835.1 aldo/keto reductase [Mesorhizobium sp. M00.F.Ca.ET.216.01.1.1]TIS58859.1 MAG: aldo/keto reductase [Mesorhizobium sp.]TIS92125.1 MAG: aldo/keto reductase [Mesorhizobium sp.]TJW17895.1 MAG: aldo/keto reductase [Mesorhizobium sp.]TJW46872.1 MAG: aldo/keto reductase [Mesorhizobium sp.]